MTIADAIAHLEARIGPREMTNIESEEVEAWLTSALQRTTEQVAQSEHARDLQRTDQLTLDGTGAVAVPAAFLTGYISRIFKDNLPVDFVVLTSRGEFAYQGNNLFPLAAVEDGKIYTKAPVDVASPLSGNINVTGIFIPTITTLPAKFEGIFLDNLVEIGQERLKLNPVGRDKISIKNNAGL